MPHGLPSLPPVSAVSFLMRACLAFALLLSAAVPSSAEVSFERDVRPILKVHCFGCHGEAKELAGGLDLRLRRLVVRGGDSGEAVAVGKSGESLLIDYVRSGEMPPGEELRLSNDDVEVLAKWVDGGAVVSGVEPEADPAVLVYRPVNVMRTGRGEVRLCLRKSSGSMVC